MLAVANKRSLQIFIYSLIRIPASFGIFDDEDDELANVLIEEWSAYENDDFYENAERILRPILCRMKESGEFDKLTILKPYSFVLVDEERETIAELLLVDDDTLLVN